MSLFDNFLGESGAGQQNPTWLMSDPGQQYGAAFASPGAMPQYSAPTPDGVAAAPRSRARLTQPAPQPTNDQLNDGGNSLADKRGTFTPSEKQASGYNGYRPYNPDDYPEFDAQGNKATAAAPGDKAAPAQQAPVNALATNDGRVDANGVYDDRTVKSGGESIQFGKLGDTPPGQNPQGSSQIAQNGQPATQGQATAPNATPAPRTVEGKPAGLVVPGNINLDNRQPVKNADGSISTVRSITIGLPNGQAALLPTVVNGRVVSNAEAIEHYKQTGEHLGVFANDQAANSYAEGLHQAQAQQYVKSYSATDPKYIDTVKRFEGVGAPAQMLMKRIQDGGSGNVDLNHFHPVFASRMSNIIADAEAATGQRAKIISGYRPYEQQAEIYERSGHGTKFAAAPPGQSRHQYGAAVDIAPGPVRDWVRANAQRYGLETLPDRLHDFGHIQLSSRDYQRGYDAGHQGVSLAGRNAPSEEQLQARWGQATAAVDKFKPDLPQGVRAAMSDYTMTSGAGWQQSGLGKAIQAGDYFGAKRMMLANLAGQRVTPNVLARRQATASWFNDAIMGQKYASGAVNGFWKALGR